VTEPEAEPRSETAYHDGYYNFYSFQTSYQDIGVGPSQPSQTCMGDVGYDSSFSYMLFGTPTMQVHYTFCLFLFEVQFKFLSYFILLLMQVPDLYFSIGVSQGFTATYTSTGFASLPKDPPPMSKEPPVLSEDPPSVALYMTPQLVPYGSSDSDSNSNECRTIPKGRGLRKKKKK
jgi:hypothetical protein